MSDKSSFVVYTDIKEMLDELTDDQVGQLFRGMVSYVIGGEDPQFSGILKFAFIPIRQGLDRDLAKWEQIKEKRADAGRKGGLRSGEVRAKQNEANEANASQTKQNEANEAVNVNVPVSVSVNESESVSVSTGVDVWSLSRSVLGYLNSSTGSGFKLDDVDSVRLISDLSHKGYTETDMKSVIDKKVADWLGDPKVEQYLRPSTLFGPKFETYLNQPSTAANEARQKQQAKQDAKARNEEKRQAYAKELEMVQDRIRTASVSERIELTGRKAWLEDEIGRLTS